MKILNRWLVGGWTKLVISKKQERSDSRSQDLPEIPLEEIRSAPQLKNNGKCTGNDPVMTEMLKMGASLVKA